MTDLTYSEAVEYGPWTNVLLCNDCGGVHENPLACFDPCQSCGGRVSCWDYSGRKVFRCSVVPRSWLASLFFGPTRVSVEFVEWQIKR